MSRLLPRVEGALAAHRPERAWDLAAEALDSSELRVRVHARQLLLALAPRLPAAAWTEARARVAAQAAITPPPVQRQVGVMAFPVIGPSGEENQEGGYFVEVRVSREAGDEDRLQSGLDPSTRDALRCALEGARLVLGEPEARFVVMFDDIEGWQGSSAGLAVALAACSAARALSLSPLLVATGAVDAAGRVVGVGKISEKLILRREARPRAQLLVPAEDDRGYPSVIPAQTLEQALAGLGHTVADVSAPLRRARDLDAGGDWGGAARVAEPLIEDPNLSAHLLEEERLELLVILLAAANHSADEAAQARWEAQLERLVTLLDPDERGEWLARAIGSRAVRRIDRLDREGAQAILALTLGWRWRSDLQVHLLGPQALLATLSGEHDQALALRQQGAACASIDERPRCLGDLADALSRLGRAHEALAAADGALSLVRSSPRRLGYRDRTTSFLHLHRARALLALGRSEEALAALDAPLGTPGLDPWLRAALLEAELRGGLPGVLAIQQDPRLSSVRSVLVDALVDRARARLGDGDAAARLLALPIFSGLPIEEVARRLPY